MPDKKHSPFVPSVGANPISGRFTVMEALVVTAIILVVGALAYPIYDLIHTKTERQNTLGLMRALGSAVTSYSTQSSGLLPEEDAQGNDTWKNAAKADSKEVWYNALPHIMGKKSVGDYADNAAAFYTKENPLYVPGADYPQSDKKLVHPLFAIAMNTKLHQKEAGATKHRVKLTDIINQTKTVVLMEQGLPSEKPTLEVQKKKDYDGGAKGSAKSFIGRYRGEGVMVFADGHAELVEAKSVLTETARIPVPQTELIWTPNPDDDPNKGSGSSSKE